MAKNILLLVFKLFIFYRSPFCFITLLRETVLVLPMNEFEYVHCTQYIRRYSIHVQCISIYVFGKNIKNTLFSFAVLFEPPALNYSCKSHTTVLISCAIKENLLVILYIIKVLFWHNKCSYCFVFQVLQGCTTVTSCHPTGISLLTVQICPNPSQSVPNCSNLSQLVQNHPNAF